MTIFLYYYHSDETRSLEPTRITKFKITLRNDSLLTPIPTIAFAIHYQFLDRLDLLNLGAGLANNLIGHVHTSYTSSLIPQKKNQTGVTRHVEPKIHIHIAIC